MICYSIGGEQFGECETVLGMQEQPNMPAFKVYPNPTTSDITLAFGISGNTNVTLRVLNILGEILISETRNGLSDGIHSIELSLANLSTGMFVIEMEANGQRFAQRVVKN